MTDQFTDTIRITPGQLADSMAFRNATALATCTTLDSDDAGMYVARNWPALSDGEELLWQVLTWLNGGRDLPSLTTLSAGLDAENYRACAELLRTAA